MVSQLSYQHGSSLDASKSRFPRIRWPNLRQKLSQQKWQTSTLINTSSTTVDSSDISLKNGIPAVATGDLSYRYPLFEWGHGHQATRTVFRPTFYKLFSKFSPQSASPNNGHYKTQGTTSHQSRSKKPDKASQRRKSSSKGARGAGSGSGGGGKGGKGRAGSNGPPPPNGWRFPPLGDTRPPKRFGCPLYMTDPLRHHECSSLRLRRSSDVSQHIMRKHLLREINLVLRRDTVSTDRAETEERMQQAGTCTNPDEINLYHARCRMEFHGLTAEESLRYHCHNLECIEAGIEDTGVLLPSEFKDLTDARDAANGSVAKWYAMWRVCYPPVTTTTLTRFRTVPASPYVETTVPREQGEHIIRQALMSASIDQSLVFDQIVNGIYLGGVETDREVYQIVQSQQRQRDLELRGASQLISASSHIPSAGLDPWRFSQETPGLQPSSPFHSSSLTLPLQQQHGLLTGQPSNSTATSSGSLPQQYQMPYRTPFSSIVPPNFPLQPQMVQQTYQNRSSNYSHPGSPPENSDPASQQDVSWWSNPADWNPDHYRGSQ